VHGLSLYIIGLSVMLASAWMIFVEIASRSISIFRVPFIVAYLLA
jgi:hypothetical protein